MDDQQWSNGLAVLEDLAAEILRSWKDDDPTALKPWGTPYAYRPGSDVPPRRWLYHPHLIRGYVSLTVAPGGTGKTALVMAEALAVATGKAILGTPPDERTNVMIWNGEDPADEIERRLLAAMELHELSREEVEGRLFLGSGRDRDLIIASQDRNGLWRSEHVLEEVAEFIGQHGIGVVIIDPFVACHRVNENDNTAIELVVKGWAKIAERTGCAVHLVHHTRKRGPSDVSAEDSRGASALLSGVRHARTLRSMSDPEAASFRIPTERRWAYVRLDDGKANLAPPARRAEWITLANIRLDNGDQVQAVQSWMPPDVEELSTQQLGKLCALVRAGCDGRPWRSSIQARDWAGRAVAHALSIDLQNPEQKDRAKELLKRLVASRILQETHASDPKKGSVPVIVLGSFGELV